MQICATEIPGVKIITPKVYEDDRGFFMETWRQNIFDNEVVGETTYFVQENHSRSCQHTLRGLHLQTAKPQGKLVRVTKGEVFDVAVDTRIDSPTFGVCIGIELSETNKKQVWIPPGCAHGFLVLSDTAEFIYKCTDYYHPESEISILWDDADLDIKWPLSKTPLLSPKDRKGLSFTAFRKQYRQA